MSDRLPEALVSRFAVAVRDVLWFRNRVERFLERAGVPSSIMAEVKASASLPTVKKCLRVVDLLEQSENQGMKIIERMIHEISEWADLSHLEPAKRSIARASQTALKAEIRAYADRRRYLEQQEVTQHQEREQYGRPRPIDHARLQRFRDALTQHTLWRTGRLAVMRSKRY